MLERVTAIAEYMLDTGATVRACARHFKVSKTTVHKDVTQRLKKQDASLYERVRHVLDQNKAQRHIRGGLATRDKYLRRKGASTDAEA